MALTKQKQVVNDPVLKGTDRSEHGFSTFAHNNVLVEKINELEAKIETLETMAADFETRIADLENPA